MRRVVTTSKEAVRALGLGLAFFAGCSAPVVHRELPAGHAANPSAPVAKVAVIANPFSLLPTFERPREGVASTPAGMQHEMGAMPGMESEMPAKERAGEGAAEVQYTCLMHPEVVLDAPGSCPKCGMTLRPIPAAHKHEEQKQ